jgi:hypothetical protein
MHVDVHLGDPSWSGPQQAEQPPVLARNIRLTGYSLPMVLVEKIVTALQPSTANTHWPMPIFSSSPAYTGPTATLSEMHSTRRQLPASPLSPLAAISIAAARVARAR